MIKYIVMLTVMLSIGGCTLFQSGSRVAIETAYLESVARTGETQQILKSSKQLTDFQMMQLTHAFNTLSNFRGKWKSFINDPTKNIESLDPDELSMDFNNIKAQYMIVYNVAIQNWDEYSPRGKLHLTDVHKHASKLSVNVDKMMKHKKYMDALKSGLEYVSMAGTLAMAFKP